MLDVEVEAVIKNNQPVTTTQTIATFRASERDSCCVQNTEESVCTNAQMPLLPLTKSTLLLYFNIIMKYLL